MNVIVILKDRVFAPVTAAHMVTLMELQRFDQQSFQPNLLGQNKCLRVSGFSSGKTRYGRPALLFYFITTVNSFLVRTP